MSALVKVMDRVLYPGVQSNWDDDRFRDEILKHVNRDSCLLDLGAGAGIIPKLRFRRQVARVCGVDLDERVLENPHLDEAKVADAQRIPYNDARFDVVIANNVLEHLEEPANVFQEVSRVLKPGGVFLAKTPNRWHYVAITASITPHWFHETVNQWRGRKSVDTFPTLYRANTPRAIESFAEMAQFDQTEFVFLEGRPEYLRLTPPTYLIGWAYERLVNLTPGATRFSAAMIAVLRKQEAALSDAYADAA